MYAHHAGNLGRRPHRTSEVVWRRRATALQELATDFHGLFLTISLKSSSVSRPRFAIERFLTSARMGARCSEVIVSPSSLHFRSMLSGPLFFPSTMRRRAFTKSAE